MRNRVAICTGRVEAKISLLLTSLSMYVAICTGRVEAKLICEISQTYLCCCNLHGACGGKVNFYDAVIRDFQLQSARGVWRQR